VPSSPTRLTPTGMASTTVVSQISALNIVMGTGNVGEAGKSGVRIHDVNELGGMLDILQAHGHSKVDTSRVYGEGTSEEYLAKVDWQRRGLSVDTKLFPVKEEIFHTPEDLRKHLLKSLDALGTKKINTWYLHGPDRSTPYEVTMKAVDELYKEGYFERFGLSNFASWEVAEIVGICRANGYIQPTVYQGLYNAIHRKVEPELFPCLRKYGISFYEFNPLAGGLLTGRYVDATDHVEEGARFDSDKGFGQLYRKRYWNEHNFQALRIIRDAAKKAELTMPEVALRWLSHHSLLKREAGDGVIIGASSIQHVAQNLSDFEKGPLPDDVVKALDEAWIIVAPYATPYFH